MRIKEILVALGLALGVLLSVTGTAEAQVCRAATNPDFHLRLAGEGLSVMFGETRLYLVSPEKWHELHDGKGQFGCAGDVTGGNDMLLARVGHANDMVLGFGLIRGEDGRPVALSVMWFLSRDYFMGVRQIGEREVELLFGRENDLHLRVCWSPAGEGTWKFSRSWRGPGKNGPCTYDAPEDPRWRERGRIERVPVALPPL